MRLPLHSKTDQTAPLRGAVFLSCDSLLIVCPSFDSVCPALKLFIDIPLRYV